MNRNLMGIITGAAQVIDFTYQYMERPDTPEPSPEFMEAFDAAVNEWRQYIASRTDQ